MSCDGLEDGVPLERQPLIRERLVDYVNLRCPEYSQMIDATLYCHRENLGGAMWSPLYNRFGPPPWASGDTTFVLKLEAPNPFDAVSSGDHAAVASYAQSAGAAAVSSSGGAACDAPASDAPMKSQPVVVWKRHALEPPS